MIFQKSKATAKLSKMGRNKPRADRFLWCHLWSPRLILLRFLPLFNTNQVIEKLYIGQWSYTKQSYPVNAIYVFNAVLIICKLM
jgi:hypothetical protein